jgi:prepilin-type N-terminal cleavage/methylation domain-containing protein
VSMSDRRWGASERGLTLVELMIGMSILVIVVGLVTHMIVNTSKTQGRLRKENQMRQVINTSLFRMASQVNQTRMLMQADTLGYAYLGRLNMTGAPPFWGGLPTANTTTGNLLLPTIRGDGSLAPEKDCVNYPDNFFRANTAGNLLFFVKYAGNFNRFTITTANMKRTLDVYEFKLFYLTNDSNLPGRNFIDFWRTNPSLRRLRLIEWTSLPYLDFTQFQDYLTDLSGADRTTIRSNLTAAGLTRVWDRSATAINNAFYSLGLTTAATPAADAAHVLPRARINDVLLSGNQDFSVAYNSNQNAASANYFPIRNPVPLFYQHNPPACNGALPAPNTTPNAATVAFPAGFEVMIVGPASGRNVLMRITSASPHYGTLVSHSNLLTTYARDL